MLADSNQFYDEYAEDECPFAPVPKGIKGFILRFLPFWSYREWKFWCASVPRGGVLLDIGAGRGKEVFMVRSSVTVGLDSSLTFLKDCAENYDLAVLSSSPKLPFPDASFDVVVSSHVIGHIERDNKDDLIEEMARVLRPGGITAHIIETDSESTVVKALKQKPEAYKRYIIDQDGHIGLELADTVVDRFKRAGFSLQRIRLVDAIIPSVMNYKKYLLHEEFGQLPGLAPVRFLSALDSFTRLGNLLYEVGFGTFHRTIEQWFGRRQNANFILASFQKPT